MKSLEKLRELACDINGNEIVSHMKLYPNCVFDGEWLDSWHREFDRLLDGIESEIAERYMPRPCYMDGVPIEIGDELSHDGFARNFIVHSYELVDGTWAVWDVANGATHICSACRHVKQRTLTDVLADLFDRKMTITDAEREISDLMGVDR